MIDHLEELECNLSIKFNNTLTSPLPIRHTKAVFHASGVRELSVLDNKDSKTPHRNGAPQAPAAPLGYLSSRKASFRLK
jgi:hypothetical protein